MRHSPDHRLLLALMDGTFRSLNSADEPGSVVIALATMGMENVSFDLPQWKASGEGSLSNTNKRNTDHKL